MMWKNDMHEYEKNGDINIRRTFHSNVGDMAFNALAVRIAHCYRMEGFHLQGITNKKYTEVLPWL